MSCFVKLLATVGTALCLVGGLHATGYFGPSIYLDYGGKKVKGSPNFTGASSAPDFWRYSSSRKIGRSKETAEKPEGGDLKEAGLRRLPTTQ